MPLLYKTAISATRNRRIAYTIGRDEAIETDHQTTGTQSPYKLRGTAGEFIPEQRIVGSRLYLTTSNQIIQAGFYHLFMQPDTTLAQFAFNFDRKESNLACFSAEELQSQSGELVKVLDLNDEAFLTAEIKESNQGISLWRWFVVLALVFLAVEVLLLRFWKV